MLNRYALSKAENIALVEKVFGNQINMQELRAFGPDIFFIKHRDIPVTIKFSDFDCKVEIRIKNPNAYSLQHLASVIKSEPDISIFSGGSRELCSAMREYKAQKFGSQYTKECELYCDLIKHCGGNQVAVESLIDIKNDIDKEYTQFKEPENE